MRGFNTHCSSSSSYSGQRWKISWRTRSIHIVLDNGYLSIVSGGKVTLENIRSLICFKFPCRRRAAKSLCFLEIAFFFSRLTKLDDHGITVNGG